MKRTSSPPLPAMFARYRDDLATELRASIPSSHQGSGQNGLPAALDDMLRYHMGWTDEEGNVVALLDSQGKALRPTLCLFACESLSGDWTKALPTAAALEFMHNFSLIHDDIQDGDTERRHRPTVWALWGQPQALTAGNAMRSLADVAAMGLTERGVPDGKALTASFLLTKGHMDMIRGQCLDLAFEGDLDTRLDDYLTMISCKTGALIRCSMEIGALVGSNDQAFIRAFARCGSFLGLAFQIRDDVLGVWGDRAATGKAVGNDIRRKKKSFPIVYALEVATDATKQKLVDIYTKADLDDKDVEDVLTALGTLNVADYAQAVTYENAERALGEMHRIPLPSWVQQEIEELVEFIATRQY